MTTQQNAQHDTNKSTERKAFIFLTVFLAPILSLIIVGGFGFIVWISQILFGPPTH